MKSLLRSLKKIIRLLFLPLDLLEHNLSEKYTYSWGETVYRDTPAFLIAIFLIIGAPGVLLWLKVFYSPGAFTDKSDYYATLVFLPICWVIISFILLGVLYGIKDWASEK